MRSVKKLCRRLGLGLMMVGKGVSTLLDPAPRQPPRSRAAAGEHRPSAIPPRWLHAGADDDTYRQAALRRRLLAEKGR
jgi:hypothetical protein